MGIGDCSPRGTEGYLGGLRQEQSGVDLDYRLVSMGVGCSSFCRCPAAVRCNLHRLLSVGIGHCSPRRAEGYLGGLGQEGIVVDLNYRLGSTGVRFSSYRCLVVALNRSGEGKKFRKRQRCMLGVSSPREHLYHSANVLCGQASTEVYIQRFSSHARFSIIPSF